MIKSKNSLDKKIFELKKKNDILKSFLKENKNLSIEKKELLEENKKLRREVEVLKSIAKKFTISLENL